MDFITKLVDVSENDFRLQRIKQYLNNIDGLRLYEEVSIDNSIKLSIQGGVKHYSYPELKLDASQYEQMEVAIIKNKIMVSIDKAIDNKRLINEFNKYAKWEDGLVVYGFVPVELIEELYQELKKKKQQK